jgi:2-keto-4-pentenoate hydratase/2-oxohepta-3-ene-1,7-dioic acid hydratase in catechol pathway
MKLLTFRVDTPLGWEDRLGAVSQLRLDVKAGHVQDAHDDVVYIDLHTAYGAMLHAAGHPQARDVARVLLPPDLSQLIALGDPGRIAAQEALAWAQTHGQGVTETAWGARLAFHPNEVALRSPLSRPNLLRDFLSFETHASYSWRKRGMELPEAWYQFPVYYKGNHRSLYGPGDVIPWPSYTNELDYELELACIIGRQGRNIPEAEAHHYIFGYTILNDFSARDIQREEMTCRLGPAKGKDFASALGPWVVTADAVGDERALRMRAYVNDALWSEGCAGTSHWTFAQMIAHVSQDETLYPGDIFGSGTVGGGCGMEQERYLQRGDIVRLEIDQLGALENRVQ